MNTTSEYPITPTHRQTIKDSNRCKEKEAREIPKEKYNSV